jgi:hypothetical protein
VKSIEISVSKLFLLISKEIFLLFFPSKKSYGDDQEAFTNLFIYASVAIDAEKGTNKADYVALHFSQFSFSLSCVCVCVCVCLYEIVLSYFLFANPENVHIRQLIKSRTEKKMNPKQFRQSLTIPHIAGRRKISFQKQNCFFIILIWSGGKFKSSLPYGRTRDHFASTFFTPFNIF